MRISGRAFHFFLFFRIANTVNAKNPIFKLAAKARDLRMGDKNISLAQRERNASAATQASNTPEILKSTFPILPNV